MPDRPSRNDFDAWIHSLGYRISWAREERALSQADLAEIAQVPPSAISHYECNRRQPSYEVLIRLAKALDCSTDYLCGLADLRRPLSEVTDSDLINELARRVHLFRDRGGRL